MEKNEKKEIVSKSDLVTLIAGKEKMSKADVEKVVDGVFSEIESSLKERKDVRIYGFGVFSAQFRDKRDARNPQTSETIHVPAHWVAKFRVLTALKQSVNNQG